MCSGSKSKSCPFDSEMDSKFQENHRGIFSKNCSKLLELAATDDLAGFIHEVEEMGCDVNEVSVWYGRRFGSKKMGFEERTPILIASLYGSLEVLKYIISTGKVDVNRSCGSDFATPLHCAAASGSWASFEVVKTLVDAFADIDGVDFEGRKPFDLIAPCVKSSSNSKRRQLEIILGGFDILAGEEEEIAGGKISSGNEKKEYPIDVSLPDINIGIYGSDEFRMYTFKVKPCSRAYSHDWTECPFVHPGENARRRDLRKYNYTCVPCPEFKKGNCGKGDSCEYAHGVFESWLHPAQYRTRLCKDETGCARKVCFFAHKPEELRPLYASTGSAMPSPKSLLVNPMDLSTLSPLMMATTTSSPPMSPSITSTSPMGGGNPWQNKVNLAPPALQLPGSRLKTAYNARDADLDIDFLGLEKIRTHHQSRQQFVEEMASLSSPYNSRINDLNPTNLDDLFGSIDPSLLSISPNINSQLQSPTGLQIRQNMNQIRASYPLNFSSSPSRKPAPYGFDSSAAVAAAVMNSRSSGFSKRSQSFNYRAGPSGPANSPIPIQSKLSEWGSPDGKLDWGFFNGEDANKLRKSASFGFRSNNGATQSMAPEEPDVSWVNSLVRDVPGSRARMYGTDEKPEWVDQYHLYMEQKQMVA